MHAAVVLDGPRPGDRRADGLAASALPDALARGHRCAVVSLVLFAASATVPSLNQLMSELINAIGVQVSFYYALAGIACVWYYRHVLFTGWKIFCWRGSFR